MCSCCLGICLKCLKSTISQNGCYSLIHHVLIWIYSWWMHGFGNDLEICFVFVLIFIQDLFLSLCLWIRIWWTCVLYNISKLFVHLCWYDYCFKLAFIVENLVLNVNIFKTWLKCINFLWCLNCCFKS